MRKGRVGGGEGSLEYLLSSVPEQNFDPFLGPDLSTSGGI